MKINAVSAVSPVSGSLPVSGSSKKSSVSGFSNIIKMLQNNLDTQIPMPNVQALGESAQLLRTQIKANNYFLKVELVSKAAEAASGSFRKLQNAQ